MTVYDALGNAIEEVIGLRDALTTKDTEIARLEAENERIREALEAIEKIPGPDGEPEAYRSQQDGRLISQARLIARAALVSIPDPAGGMPVEMKP